MRFGELDPALLQKANIEAQNQAGDTTGLREIAARMSSAISRGAYENKIDIDASERPRKVKYLIDELRNEHEIREIEEDVAPLRRDEIVKIAMQTMGELRNIGLLNLMLLQNNLRVILAWNLKSIMPTHY